MTTQRPRALWAGNPVERFQYELDRFSREHPDEGFDTLVFIYISDGRGTVQATYRYVNNEMDVWLTKITPTDVITRMTRLFNNLHPQHEEAALVAIYNRATSKVKYLDKSGAEARHWMWTPTTINDLIKEAASL